MLRIMIALFTITISTVASAAELEEGKIYRLSMTVEVNSVNKTDTVKYTAMKNSKFEVISRDDNRNYIVRFDKIYTSKDTNFATANWVKWDQAYILPAKIEGTIAIEKVSKESLTGLSAGPLVVPFKYRTGDKSLTGDATIGMYAGITLEPYCSQSNWCFRLTPLLSAGLSQVSIANGTESESKTSATWAVGFLITSWADLNIGIIYGEDRIGDETWEHEGDGWWSIMIGWEL